MLFLKREGKDGSQTEHGAEPGYDKYFLIRLLMRLTAAACFWNAGISAAKKEEPLPPFDEQRFPLVLTAAGTSAGFLQPFQCLKSYSAASSMMSNIT